jgi:hypothetical protein
MTPAEFQRLAQLFLPGAKAQKKWDEVKPYVRRGYEYKP